ncbi:MAG: branched-chain amino acid transport system permease protein, partial [Gaiellaceae bacterium]|nr:branched-chain amino acid transport system permease protein [Gaiellaceae bacterium]
MTGHDDIPPIPARPDEAQAPRVGVDEWVASHGERREQRTGLLGRVQTELERLPGPTFFLAFGVAAALLPLFTSNGYIIRVGFDTLLYMLLALGLNIVVGYAGLLDLGYVAFYGVGAYAYALLDSPHYGIHLPFFVAIPVVTLIGALVGFLLGLPSMRLTGDYLAIVTLFFLQLFQTITTNAQGITGGPFGIL